MGDMRDATHEDIMKKAKAKFDLLVNSGKWGAKSPDQEKISHSAQVKELKDSAKLIRKLEEDDTEMREVGDENTQDENNGTNNSKAKTTSG
eukprot:CCRYP_006288-RA/>CCRYP_006288-RA protein AED:0.46 eAED:0.46 QI:0/-1/0/1/-1/1/1/0/90